LIQEGTEKLAAIATKQKAALTTPVYSVGYRSKLPPKNSLQTQLDSENITLHAEQDAVQQAKGKATPSEISTLIEKMNQSQERVNDLSNLVATYDDEVETQKKLDDDRKNQFDKQRQAISDLAKQQEDASREQVDLQETLGGIDDMVNQLFISNDAEQGFKLSMSRTFAILVGVVIVGFFLVAISNEEIKKTIFSNEAGIQFITLFAIVIAVILFGIIGVLQDKELSALLGGLSGYILGKSHPPNP
jgi:hypothetical protein